ncbi:carboxypeptidase-like regulatory domain-containing protein [uncultured Roseivirga sp.]|uniref:carboxypeptidase-like regulatory domain-containing protein n=1 Tax=uncultured Roseivirga sp. TaxID=543088 RepID=UPI0030DCEB42|tara:strand:+ start:135858 stop:138638 length:2781 start_codon:yes stop_codon:yes gene_type:complete
MKIVYLLFFLVVTIQINAQNERTFSGSFNQEALQNILLKIKDDLDVSFYYRVEWVDSISYTGNFQNANLEYVLDQIVLGSEITYFYNGNSIYLTHGLPIIRTPIIVGSIVKNNNEENLPDTVPKSVLFTREYVPNQLTSDDKKNRVYEIGNKADFKQGATSTIAGFITSNETEERIDNAVIYSIQSNKSTISDETGFYSISLTNGQNELYVQYSGMKTAKRKIVLFSNGKLDIGLETDVIALSEIVVEAERGQNVESVSMGMNRLNIEETKVIPVVLGEKDILKVATTFAGVQTVGEGAAGINVRGGKSDQNLFLLDGATVYNASHFLGFFSVFNSDALEDLEILKTGIPAKYGGRLASVFDITSKKAGKSEFGVEGGVSPITSRLTVEAPIIKDKASLLLSGRATYSNWVLDLVDNSGFRGNVVEFSDLILNYDHDLSPKDNLSISGYLSHDYFKLNSDTLFSFSDFSYVNNMASTKWTHQFSSDFDVNFTGSYSKYKYEFETSNSPANAFIQDFQIKELGAKADFNYEATKNQSFNFGLETKHYIINPGSKKALGEESNISSLFLDEERAYESAIYFSDQYEISEKFTVNGGIRYSLFSAIGPGQKFIYSENSPLNEESIIDTVTYSSGDIIKTYQGAEFRFSLRYLLNESSSIKTSFGRNMQYIHSLSNTSSVSPTDIWRLSNGHIKPQISNEISLGYFRDFEEINLETSLEVYAKELENLIDFKTGSNFLLNNSIEMIALQGPGKAYGIELSAKKLGQLHGWLNYSYARTFIKLEGDFAEEIINDGNFFPTNYDIPHTINLVSNYDVTQRFSLSYNFTYKTGRPVTLPVGSYSVRGVEQINYSARNSSRIPYYLRMDLGITLKWGHRTKKLTRSFWSLSVYNLFGRDNPYSVYFDVVDGEVKGYKLTVFGSAVPTITYNFKF